MLISEDLSVNHNYFYLGDIEPINITNWAIRIRRLNNQTDPITMPKWLLKFAANLGDILWHKLGISKFPMNSFRFKNMTSNNIIKDIKRTVQVTNCGSQSNFDQQILKTLNWLKLNK